VIRLPSSADSLPKYNVEVAQPGPNSQQMSARLHPNNFGRPIYPFGCLSDFSFFAAAAVLFGGCGRLLLAAGPLHWAPNRPTPALISPSRVLCCARCSLSLCLSLSLSARLFLPYFSVVVAKSTLSLYLSFLAVFSASVASLRFTCTHHSTSLQP